MESILSMIRSNSTRCNWFIWRSNWERLLPFCFSIRTSQENHHQVKEERKMSNQLNLSRKLVNLKRNLRKLITLNKTFFSCMRMPSKRKKKCVRTYNKLKSPLNSLKRVKLKFLTQLKTLKLKNLNVNKVPHNSKKGMNHNKSIKIWTSRAQSRSLRDLKVVRCPPSTTCSSKHPLGMMNKMMEV